MSEHLVAISARHDDGAHGESWFGPQRIPASEPEFDGLLYLNAVFAKVFSFYREIALPEPCAFRLRIPALDVDETLRLTGAAFLLSKADRLGGTESNDHFLVLSFAVSGDAGFPALKSRGVRDKDLVAAYLDALRGLPPFQACPAFLEIFDVPFPGLYGGQAEAVADARAGRVLPFLFAFYYYAHLICWRLEREQNGLELSHMMVPDDGMMRSIMNQRLRVINLKRYFLTNNRSSHSELQQFCRERVEAHRLEQKYDRYRDTLELFEIYVNNVSTMSQERGSRAVRKTVGLLTFTAIPLGIFGFFMELSVNKDILTHPERLFSSSRIWLLVCLSILIPALIVGAGHLWDRHGRHKQTG